LTEAKVFDFSTFPVLETARLRLRQLTDTDADAVIAIFSSPEVLRYMDADPVDTREGAERFIRWTRDYYTQQGGIRWGLTLRDGDDTVIGTCGFHYWNRASRRADIGYDLHPAYWRQGYMSEAVRMLLGWCFDNLNLHRIQADCTSGNIASERLLEKMGFTLEGIWREHTFEHGRFVDIKQYGLLRREFLPGSR
jgi:Acetyltransferases, including N-acetylases of ribosomal proteins